MFMEPGQSPNPMCDKCKGDQKNTPWLGLTIIKGMQRKGLDYEGGTILNPIDGNEWSALMHLSLDFSNYPTLGRARAPVSAVFVAAEHGCGRI